MTDSEKQTMLQLHMQEYQALSNRCTYYLTVTYGVFGALVAYVALIFSVKSNDGFEMNFWYAVAGSQIFLLIGLVASYDAHNLISYIQMTLKPKMLELAPDKFFWMAEALRPNGYLSSELGLLSLSAFIIVLVIILYHSQADMWFMVATIITFLLNVLIGGYIMHKRKSYTVRPESKSTGGK